MRWSSVLPDNLRVAAQDRLAALTSNLARPDDKSTAAELCDRALLSAYRGRCESNAGAYVHAVEYLNAAAERVSNRLPSGAFEGLSAIGWTTEHLRAMLIAIGVVATDIDEPADPLQELEQLLLLRLRSDAWLGSYDLISGLSGVGLFLLERLPSAPAREGISLVVEHLDALAEQRDCGVTWFTPARLVPESQRDQAPDGYYNLGVAHGVPGVIYILCEIGAAGIERPRVDRLIDDSVRWLLAQRQPSPNPSLYPNWIAPNRPTAPSRLAWCYGDLGIAAVLHHVARRRDHSQLRTSAIEAFERCLTRWGDIQEPTLCHGALGIAHMFNRVYQREGDARFLEAANRYYQVGLSLLEARQKHLATGDESNRGSSSEFLQGDVGAALALLAALHPVEPNWDRRLLISGRQVSTLSS